MLCTLLVLFVLVLSIFLLITWRKLNSKNQYWKRKNIKQGSPTIIFGDKWKIVTRQESLADMVQSLYRMGGTDRYCGAYDFMSPTLVIKDPELVKYVTVRDFNHFTDHKRVIPENSDPIWDKNLFFLTGQRWKEMRNSLSPAFTGAKLRHLFHNITKTADEFTNHFAKNSKDTIDVEIKDIFARFTNDIIASTVFGIRCNSMQDKNNKFFEMSKRISDFRGLGQAIRMFGYFIIPSVYKALNLRILSAEVANFFYGIVKENIKSRLNKKLASPDMINLLLETRESHRLVHGLEITDEDITAQALVFFFAGFDSVSSLMCFMSYELALNTDVQRKLLDEIDETRQRADNGLTYDVIKNMKYLDMVVLETLRKWPITPFVNRVCTKPYTIEPTCPGEAPIRFKEFDIIFLPIYGFHRDPEYYPDPERFDPDRFNEENVSRRNPYVFLPFGTGPRKCIGYRFALMEVKILFYYLLSNFTIEVNGRTQIPVKLSKKAINMTPEGGLHVNFKKR